MLMGEKSLAPRSGERVAEGRVRGLDCAQRMRAFIITIYFFLAVSAFAADQPSVKVGATIFADYTLSNETSAFNLTRAYINIFGTLNEFLSARVTPDIARETGEGSSLNGSLQFRLKYAYAQVNFSNGSWIRGGLVLLWVEYEEQLYHYRFQGPVFVDREGYVGTADYGVAGRYVLPNDLGDVAAGVFNGEGFSHAETNDQKAAMLRVSLQPLRHLRVSGFVDKNNYSAGQPRDREVAQLAYEHLRVTAAIDWLSANDRDVKSHGYSAWVTPRISKKWEVLLRRDVLRAGGGERKTRDIEGIAYWVPLPSGVAAAVMLDRDDTRGAGPSVTSYGLKMMLSF